MRGWKAPALITFYLGVLVALGGIFFYAQEANMRYNLHAGFDPKMVFVAFLVLLVLELGLILVITPALTAGSISGERERQTLDLLLCTKLSPFSIIWGKLLASVSQIVILIFASLPVFGIMFLYGGVGLPDFFIFMLFYIATAVMVGSMGIFFSAFFKKSVFATVTTYVVVLFMTVGTLVGYFIFGSIYYPRTGTSPTLLQVMLFNFCNPVVGFLSVIDQVTGLGNELGREFSVLTNPSHPLLKPWVINVAFDAAASSLLILLSTFALRSRKK